MHPDIQEQLRQVARSMGIDSSVPAPTATTPAPKATSNQGRIYSLPSRPTEQQKLVPSLRSRLIVACNIIIAVELTIDSLTRQLYTADHIARIDRDFDDSDWIEEQLHYLRRLENITRQTDFVHEIEQQARGAEAELARIQQAQSQASSPEKDSGH